MTTEADCVEGRGPTFFVGGYPSPENHGEFKPNRSNIEGMDATAPDSAHDSKQKFSGIVSSVVLPRGSNDGP